MINTSSKRLVSGVCAASALLAGSVSLLSAKVVDETVATVNGQPILMSEYLKNKDSVMEQYRKGMPEFFQQKNAAEQLEKKVLDQMIDDSLLYQEAEKLKIKIRERELENGVHEIKRRFQVDEAGKPVSEEEAEAAFRKELNREALTVEQFKDRIRRQLMVRRVIDDSIRPKVKPPEEKEVREYFNKLNYVIKGDTSVLKGMDNDDSHEMLSLAQRFKDLISERVRVRHILIKADEKTSIVEKSKLLKKAQELKKRIDNGEEFADIARKHSEDTESAQRGGDIGFIVRGWMVPEFEKKAFTLGVGETSDPVETKFGYHIMRVEEKKAAQKLAFDDVKEDLAQYIANKQMQTELLSFIKDLRTKASIQITAPKKAD